MTEKTEKDKSGICPCCRCESEKCLCGKDCACGCGAGEKPCGTKTEKGERKP